MQRRNGYPPALELIDETLPTTSDANDHETRRLVALIHRSRALTGILSAEGIPVYLSPAAVEVHTGKQPDESFEVAKPDLIHPDDFEALAHSFGVSLERPEEPIAVRYRTRHADGSWRIIQGTYTNLLDDPDIGGIVLDIDDVTEQTNAEEALRASETRNRRVVDSLAEGIILLDHGGTIVACNPAAADMLALRREELVGRTHLDPEWNPIRRDGTPFPPDERPANKTRLTGEPCRDVVMGVDRSNGERTWVSVNSVVIESDDAGEPSFVAVSVNDITAVVDSGAEIEQNELRFRTLIARSSDVITVIDPDLRISYVSGAVEQILGYRVEELIGRSAIELIHPDDVDEAVASVARTLMPDTVGEPLELRLLHAQGHWVYLEALGMNLMDDPFDRGRRGQPPRHLRTTSHRGDAQRRAGPVRRGVRARADRHGDDRARRPFLPGQSRVLPDARILERRAPHACRSRI